MDELREARKRWLDELQRNVDLQAENERLRVLAFELQAKLIQQAAANAVQMMTSVPVTALFALRRTDPASG
jgi:ribosomal protein L12E/L44/L45/RPP1/RPP2